MLSSNELLYNLYLTEVDHSLCCRFPRALPVVVEPVGFRSIVIREPVSLTNLSTKEGHPFKSKFVLGLPKEGMEPTAGPVRGLL